VKIQDGTHFSPKTQLPSGSYRYVTAKNVRPGRLDLSDLTYLEEADHRQIYARCDPRFGDVLLVKDGVNAGDTAVNTLNEEFSLLSSVCFLRPRPDLLDPHFLCYFLRSPQATKQLTARLTGTAIRRIVLRQIRDLPLVIAPLHQQREIVAALDSYFSRLDEAEAGLERVQRNLKRYRASVLQAAVTGRLVPTEAELARAEGREYEPASELLKRILVGRRRRWEESGKRGRYQEPNPPDTSSLPDLPEGWCWATLKQITSAVRPISYGILMPKEHQPDGVLYVKVKDMKKGRLESSTLQRTSPKIAAAYSRSSLRAGDLLIAIRGTYGRVVEVPEWLDGGNITQDTARLDLAVDLQRSYVRVVLESPATQRVLKKVARGVAVKGVNIGDLRLLPIPLPPVSEQARLAETCEDQISVLDQQEAATGVGLAHLPRLRQSILKWAFEGKLVNQDPNDEPAEVLLDRIQAQQAPLPERPAALKKGRHRRAS